jgi:hypothetical protein
MNFVLEMVVKLFATESFVETPSCPASRRTSQILPFFFMENNHPLPSTFDPTIASWPETDES